MDKILVQDFLYVYVASMNEMTPLPLWQRVGEDIIARIVSGDLKPGVMLPSETDLGAEMGVSQGTARRALAELERRGIVERRQGRGTVVATTTPDSDHFHFFRLRDAKGSEVTPVLEVETVEKRRSTAAEREAFGEDARQVYAIDRLRSINGKRIVRESSVIPVTLFAALETRAPLPNALYAFYQQAYGIAIQRADERLRAVSADAADAAAMDVETGDPMIEVTRRAIDLSERVVEIRCSRYVTDDLAYAVTLR